MLIYELSLTSSKNILLRGTEQYQPMKEYGIQPERINSNR